MSTTTTLNWTRTTDDPTTHAVASIARANGRDHFYATTNGEWFIVHNNDDNRWSLYRTQAASPRLRFISNLMTLGFAKRWAELILEREADRLPTDRYHEEAR